LKTIREREGLLHEELHILYSSPNIIRQIKSRRMRWARRGTHGREKFTGVWWECQKERDHSEDQGVDGKMISEWIIGKLPGGVEWIQLAQDRGR
jgi:hypothetical protein